jgi:hypothetical protein
MQVGSAETTKPVVNSGVCSSLRVRVVETLVIFSKCARPWHATLVHLATIRHSFKIRIKLHSKILAKRAVNGYDYRGLSSYLPNKI